MTGYGRNKVASDSYLRERLKISDRTALVTLIIGLIYGLISLMFFPLLSVFPFIAAAIGLAALFLNRKGALNTSRVLLATCIIFLDFLYHASLTAPGEDMIFSLYLSEVAFSLFPWLLFSFREKRLLLGTTGFNLLLLVSQSPVNNLVTASVDSQVFRSGLLVPATFLFSFMIFFYCLFLLLKGKYLIEKENYLLIEKLEDRFNLTDRDRAVKGSFLSLLLESVDYGILALGEDGMVIFYNKKFCEIWNIPENLPDGVHDNDLLAYALPQVQTPDEFETNVKEVYKTDKIFKDILTLKDGRTIERSTSPVFLESVNIGRLWTFKDISQRRELEDELQDNQLTLQSVLSTAPLGIAVLENRRFLWANDMLLQQTGYSSDEIIGRDTRLLYPTEEEYDSTGREVYLGQIDKKMVSIDTRFIRKDKSIVDIRLFITKIDTREKKNRIVIIVQDITSEKKATSNFKKTMDRLTRAQEVARIGNFEFTIDSGKIWGSPMARHLMGLETDRLTVDIKDVLERIYEDDRPIITMAMNDLQEGETESFEDTFKLYNTIEKRDLHLQIIAERDKDEQGNKITGTLQDVSLHKKDEEELVQKNNQLIQLYVENQRAREQLKKAQVVAKIGSWDFFPKERTFRGSEESDNILGVKKGDPPLTLESILTYIVPEDRQHSLMEFTDFIAGITEEYDSIYTIYNKLKKKRITVHSIAEKKLSKNGEVTEVNGTIQDITRISEAEEEVRNKNIELQALNEELNATVEELEATNEEFEAQNEELLTAQARIEESERQYRSIVQDQTELIVRCDINGSITFANNAYCNYFRMDFETVIGKKFIPDIYRDDFQKVIDTFRSLTPESPVRQLENRVNMPDGKVHWIQWTMRAFFDSKNNPVDYQFVGRDNTEQKNTEDELIRLATVIEQANEDIIITDLQGNIQYVNPSFEKTTGFSRSEVIGKNPRIMKSGSHPREFYAKLWHTITSGKVWKGQLVNRTKRGDIIIQDAAISPLKNLQGKITGYTGIRRDVTDRIKMESQLTQVQKMEAIGTLAGGLAHDFNNILGGILGSTDMLRILLDNESISQSERVEKYINTIKEASNRAAEMIKQLLSLSRRQESDFASVNLNEAVVHVAEICRNSLPKSVRIHVDTHSEPCTVYADQVQIEQVLLNLCVNASHAMTLMKEDDAPEGGELNISLEPFTSDENFTSIHPDTEAGTVYWLLQVADTGIGMEEEVLEKIFDPFFTTKPKEDGTGLGLSMAYNIIQKHKGVIEVESTPGKGSTFSIFLPEYVGSDVESEDKAEESMLIPGSGTILVIDDENIVLAIAEGLLTEAGYTVLTAESGDRGIALYQEHADRISAVLLDLSMPGKSGRETFHLLKETDPDVKVILASGFKQDERVSELLNSGVLDFIQKPYSAHTLTSSLKKILK